jgi:HAD superfamily hydrolase (TIGR01509 family)
MLTIFDCDGVLVDSELIALDVLSTMMGEYGDPMDVAACREAFMGLHNADIIRAIEKRLGRPLPGEGPIMRERMLERLRREMRPVRGIADVLGRLDGPRCVASSSDRERIGLLLELAGLTGFFGDNIFSGMDVARGKPAPDLFLHAARTMGVAPDDCVVIEDSVTGVTAGVAAGMRVIGFTGASHTHAAHAGQLRQAGAAMVIDSMDALPDAIAGNVAGA